MTATVPSFDDTEDFADADRGFIDRLDPAVITAADGRVVWDNDAYAFLAEECPATADPSLWRQGRLAARQGLYQVTEGIYQVRGLDLSNMTLVEGDRGVIVIDPLISAETAAAALALYRRNRGDRPVTGLIYTHSHGDHFGGARGVLPHGHEPVPVIAPRGFLEHAVSENVYAGTAMTRRAVYMYGTALPKEPTGQIGCGLGMDTSTGTITLIAPTVDITRTGQLETVDGVRIVFQLTPGTEAPAEMNFHFPDRRALCLAENATHTLHNVLTLRGAVVRDARIWAHYLDEALTLFGADSEVAFASHHWPTWGQQRIADYLTGQRDVYAYLHDQTLRLLNTGLTGAEIAEELALPPELARTWAVRGYYGSLSHNVKAIYQRYMGWYDGNPAHLWEHPPVELAKRHTDALGGVDAAVAKGMEYAAAGDPRFAATLLNHAVFAQPDHQKARLALAEVYDSLGQGAENGTWRNCYLTAAMELRGDPATVDLELADPEMSMALTVGQLIDSLAIRVNGPRAWGSRLTIDWLVAEERRGWRLTLSNGALTQRSAALGKSLGPGPADLTLKAGKAELLGLLAGSGLEGIEHSGDPAALERLFALLDSPSPDFPIVTP
ncbi:alkyl sulfatase BDS1-like metallo-beta-lactamase superfamily hydrolase [Kitasatospora sp. MAP12-15]|uniref:alkyl/aryl-sulfatase n=1 Tax=unclassified Kitasatospora TaxID=2633591 RepID=UPI0024734378|nr:alkyl sulfatase dimerization domain-containing protein [Kitasatospora sp. MAP12-44]MDH6111784.1 alkyl sulfatase BDS1-like metallo-beta-lactamase superfamily hydrolase [Kitasatospora sp. MAP12-44]